MNSSINRSVVFVNCLLKQFAIFLGKVAVFLLNVMVQFCGVGAALLERPWIVFHIVCVLCLWSKLASRCSFHKFCLCNDMSVVISELRGLRAGLQGFALLMLSLCMILHTMCSGNNLEVLDILPFGMLSLSASRIILVKILLAVCMLSGMVVCEKANSVSFVHCVQLAFL